LNPLHPDVLKYIDENYCTVSDSKDTGKPFFNKGNLKTISEILRYKE
jgi:hypothetical protein